jgi:hypothetical protein
LIAASCAVNLKTGVDFFLTQTFKEIYEWQDAISVLYPPQKEGEGGK